jgi:hypothetical protein
VNFLLFLIPRKFRNLRFRKFERIPPAPTFRRPPERPPRCTQSAYILIPGKFGKFGKFTRQRDNLTGSPGRPCSAFPLSRPDGRRGRGEANLEPVDSPYPARYHHPSLKRALAGLVADYPGKSAGRG